MDREELIMLSAASIYGQLQLTDHPLHVRETYMRTAIGDARRLWSIMCEEKKWLDGEKEWLVKVRSQ